MVKAESDAPTAPGADANKTRLARLSGIVGELWREMTRYAAMARDGVEKAAEWVKTLEKVEKIWKTIEPFIKNTPDP